MLVIVDQDYVATVLAWAKSQSLAEQLQAQLDRLGSYAECHLGKDFAPHSFSFAVYRDGQFLFNGGLIYQGPEQPADGSPPSFTVSLAEGTGWFIHT